MLLKFIFLFTIAIIVVQGDVPLSRIFPDATEMSDLHKRYMDHSPYKPFRGQMKTKCTIMLECCPSERANFFDLMRLHTFEDTCIGNRASPSVKSRSSKCQNAIRQLDDIKRSPEYSKFNKALSGIPGSDERFRKWRADMAEICPAVELEAQYCEPEDMDKFRSCLASVLTVFFMKHDEQAYDAYVKEWKSQYETYIKRLSKAFPSL